jgi:hypothetical protein
MDCIVDNLCSVQFSRKIRVIRTAKKLVPKEEIVEKSLELFSDEIGHNGFYLDNGKLFSIS